ncbi:hypothetical protein B0H14DRAFT_2573483 [Mycena olivaceomarginata]|nr:hypothetical protein B0H14DRAFT_2573483 [Mycena olivaceomarginata]
MFNQNTRDEALGNLGIKVGIEPSTDLSTSISLSPFHFTPDSQPSTKKHNKSIYLHFEIIMVLFTSKFLTLLSWAAVISAATVNMVKKDCTLMTGAELGARQFWSLPSPAVSPQAHNAIDAAALADHGDHSHNLVVNDPDFPGSPANVCDNLATGTVWVEYNDRVDGHFKWAYSMDAILTPEERTVA